MTTIITKSSLFDKIWKNFYEIISDNVKSVIITGNKTITVKSYVAAYPDKKLDSKKSYPIIIIHFPKLDTEPFTFTKTKVNGTISIEILTNQAEAADKFSSLIEDTVETNKFSFAGINLKEIELENSDSQMYERGVLKVHDRTLSFSFNFKYTKTRAF